MEIFEFEIPGHTTRREWAAYIIIATNISSSESLFYVGKVGDNRDGCNPFISRIGNHLSHTQLVSQLRNKVEDTASLNYRVVYSIFGTYVKANHAIELPRINEVERRLNWVLQRQLSEKGFSSVNLINPYKGKYVSAAKKRERARSFENRGPCQKSRFDMTSTNIINFSGCKVLLRKKTA